MDNEIARISMNDPEYVSVYCNYECDARAYIDAMRANTHVVSLTFSALTPQQLRILAGILKNNNTVETLIFKDIDMRDAGARDIADVIRVSRSLATVTMTRCSIGVDGGNAIAGAMCENTSIHDLCLSNNDVSNVDFEPMLVRNNTMLWLDLYDCCIGDNESIGRGLAVNRSLRYLNLSMNRVSDKLGIAIADALGGSCIESIHLFHNRCTNLTGVAIANAVRASRVLVAVQIYCNLIDRETMLAIVDAMRACPSMREEWIDIAARKIPLV